ncbi:MAG: prepilin peptidase [Vampirovibrionales bacterium]
MFSVVAHPQTVHLFQWAWLPQVWFGIPGPHHPISLILAGLIGACMGSFLNLVAHRFLTNQSIVSPASHCPQCQYPLAWYDNIPLISFGFLNGSCRQCKASIGWGCWLTELITALLYMAALWAFGWSWQTVFVVFFISQLVVIFITDWQDSLIFELNSLPLIPAGLLYNLLGLGHNIWPQWAWHPANQPLLTIPLSHGDWVISYAVMSSLLGIGMAWIFFEGIIALSQKFLGTDGFGHGDTHLMMGVGAFLGWEAMAVALFSGFFIQTVIAIPWMVWRWFLEKRWVALCSAVGSVSLALLPLAAPWIQHQWGVSLLLTTLISSVGAMVCLWIFLRQLRNQTEYLYVPLGPSLIGGTLATLLITLWQASP